MKTFFAAFAGCLLAVLVSGFVAVMAWNKVMTPYYGLTLVAAHKIIGGPDEARRIIEATGNETPEQVEELVQEFYRGFKAD